MTLDRRLEKLERIHFPTGPRGQIFLARFQLHQEAGPLRAVEADGVVYLRTQGEDEDRFLDRVIRAMPRARPGCYRVMLEVDINHPD